MLTELYSVVKDSYPTHGLELVFVSSDRNENEFQNYFNSMPWLALPFASYQKQILSAVYGVKGIPSLVILDALSGQIVVPVTETRQHVQRACNFGDSGIMTMVNDWFARVPQESRELIHLLESSCEPDVCSTDEDIIPRDYLVAKEFREKQKATQLLITELIEDGMDEEEAREAAATVEALSEDDPPTRTLVVPGPLDQKLRVVEEEETEVTAATLCKRMASTEGREKVHALLTTTVKYLNNCAKSPWTTKFRKIHLSFRTADMNITSVNGGVELLEKLGFVLEVQQEDYVARIPVSADVSGIIASVEKLVLEHAPMELA